MTIPKAVPVETAAYTVVPEEENISDVPVPVVGYTVATKEQQVCDIELPAATTAFDLSKPVHTVSQEYAHVPETAGLTWEDDFFDDEDDVVAVFDLDYPEMESYYSKVGWTVCIGSSICIPNVLGIALLAGFPCFYDKNVRWNTRAQHVAITRDGVRFVHDRRPTCWGFPCSDAGKQSKTIPFDQITDCDIVEAAGNSCLCIPNRLHSVHVDTASSSDRQRHELSLSGLKDPYAFKKLVWAMKRHYHPIAARLPAAMEMADRGNGNENVATLLREIRDELRQNNEVLQCIKTPAKAMEPSAPCESI